MTTTRYETDGQPTTDTAERNELATIIASRRGVTARVNTTDREVADCIIAAGFRKT